MIRTLCVAALLTAVPALLAAQETENRCPDVRTQAEMTECAGMELARADAALNETYQRVLRTIQPARVEALRAAQRAWIRFRDAECDFQASEFAGGTMAPMIEAMCVAHLTEQRTEELRSLLSPARGGG